MGEVCPLCGFRTRDWGETCMDCYYVERYLLAKDSNFCSAGDSKTGSSPTHTSTPSMVRQHDFLRRKIKSGPDIPSYERKQEYRRDEYKARQIIFEIGKAIRSKPYLNRKVIDAYLNALELYEKGLEKIQSGDLDGAGKVFSKIQRDLLTVRAELSDEGDREVSDDGKVAVPNAIGFVLNIAALLMFVIGVYAGSAGWIRFEATVLSFAVLVFMIGTTLIARDASIQRKYLFYMWFAAFIIIGALNGVSVIGTVVRP